MHANFLIPAPPRARRVEILSPLVCEMVNSNTARATAFKLRAREALSLSSLNGKDIFLQVWILRGMPEPPFGRAHSPDIWCIVRGAAAEETSRSDRVCFEHTRASRRGEALGAQRTRHNEDMCAF